MTTHLECLNFWKAHTISRFDFCECNMNSYVVRLRRFANENVYSLCNRVEPSKATLIEKS